MLLGLTFLLAQTLQGADYDKDVSAIRSELRRDFYAVGEAGVPMLGMAVTLRDLGKMLQQYGSKPELHRLVAETALRGGQYAVAAEHAKEAVRLEPNDARSAALLRDAQRRVDVSKSCPANPVVLAPCRPGQWLAITATKSANAQGYLGMKPWLKDTRVHLLSETNVVQSLSPFAKGWEACEVTLVNRDFDGDKVPEVVVWGVDYGAGPSRPIRVNLLGLSKGKLASMGSVGGDEGMALADLKHSGKTQLLATHSFGFSYLNNTSFLQPTWTDIYVLEKGKLLAANERFPEQFADEATQIARMRTVASSDPEILLYRARLQAIQGNKQAAAKTIRKAEQVEKDVYRDLLSIHGQVGSDVADMYAERCVTVRRRLKELRGRLNTGKGL
jgi:hypothetical protein